MSNKIPYGYRICQGKACIDETQAEQLLRYFSRYLEGASMAEAAREAGLSVSASAYPRLFRKKEYLGTSYYPPLISSEYQKKLVSEWERRKNASCRKRKQTVRKAVRIHTQFRWEHGEEPSFPELQETDTSTDPVQYLSRIYQRILPDS